MRNFGNCLADHWGVNPSSKHSFNNYQVSVSASSLTIGLTVMAHTLIPVLFAQVVPVALSNSDSDHWTEQAQWIHQLTPRLLRNSVYLLCAQRAYQYKLP